MILYCRRLIIGRGNELVVISSYDFNSSLTYYFLQYTNLYQQFLSVSIQIYPSTNMPKEKPLRAVASENYLLNTNALVQLQVSMISINVNDDISI